MAPRPWTRADYVGFFEKFLAGPGVKFSVTRFGYHAVGEPSFLKNLREGQRKIRLETIERAVEFCQTYAKNEVKKKVVGNDADEYAGS